MIALDTTSVGLPLSYEDIYAVLDYNYAGSDENVMSFLCSYMHGNEFSLLDVLNFAAKYPTLMYVDSPINLMYDGTNAEGAVVSKINTSVSQSIVCGVQTITYTLNYNDTHDGAGYWSVYFALSTEDGVTDEKPVKLNTISSTNEDFLFIFVSNYTSLPENDLDLSAQILTNSSVLVLSNWEE